MDLLHFLIRVNEILTAGVSATAFALVLYLFFYNHESRVARAFSWLLGCVIIVYLMDLLLTDIREAERAEQLLRLQWIGIAFTPPFYIEFVRSIRLSVQEDRLSSWLRPVSFLLSAVITFLVMYTDWVVYDGMFSAGAPHLRPGPLFYPFALFFAFIALWGLRETLIARRRCYTRAARRRMAYLLIGFVAPALGVFPYLLLSGWSVGWSEMLLRTFLIVGNIAVAVMLVFMAYSVAFIGALTPERVIKHRLVRFLLRGPVSAIVALIAFGIGLTLERALGLGPYTLSFVSLAAAVIIAQLGVELSKPLLDLALYRETQPEVVQVQELSQRLLTTTDLHQFLENVLAALCELLHSEGGFIAILENGELRWEIWAISEWQDMRISPDAIAELPFSEVAKAQRQDRFIFWNGYWVMTIRDKAGQQLLGLIGIHAPDIPLPLDPDQEEMLEQLLLQAGAALEDRRLQHVVFEAFSPLLSELQDIQRRGSMLRYGGESAVGFALVKSPEFPQWVHNALSHYWGGPRLTENPLLDLEVVKRAAVEYDGNTVKGLRAVLSQAIEQLRPDGERKLTAPEWLLYNILEMKFLRG
ncbi:MAG: hypothetical protein JXA33_08035, partial [Anaerolineae bacterium]|nr:hypothetical protein [Anaerolineae bacterium]